VVDDFLRTSNRRVSAAGDVASPWQFTHAADAQARVVLQNALFSLRRKASVLRIPWSTYTDPEVAGVGLSKRTASERGLSYETVEVPFAELDRAILEGETEGFLRILVDRRGRILGASVFARNAGDLIAEISVAMAAGLPLGKLSQVIHPYPTRAEAVRKAADIFNRGRFGPRLKQILGTYFSWRFG
jgi:pyruvate/2-oxoglutarate dehydrogenase complex dihydrolipoamide dehydrogenase (E3) component